jgi:hypothetical protein
MAIRTHLEPLKHITPSLCELETLLDHLLCTTTPAQVLLKAKKVAPNQKSWPETAQVMGVKVKMKRASAHTDPYSAGERSGKKAKVDARVLIAKPKALRYVYC